jgi:hypothetical protein
MKFDNQSQESIKTALGQLIAAAPDLYVAAKNMIDAIYEDNDGFGGEDPEYLEAFEKLIEAVSKAEGK